MQSKETKYFLINAFKLSYKMKIKFQWTPNTGRKMKINLFTFILLVFSLASIAQSTYYIDPSYSGATSNGSLATPYKTWNGVAITNGNTYLQKRGTTFQSSAGIAITSKNNVTIGSYGSGERPKLSYTGSGHAVRIESSSNCTVKDFDVNGNGNAISLVYISGTSATYTNNITVNNCNLYNAHNSNNGGFGVYGFNNTGLKILYTDIHNVALDGMYLKFEPNIEIGYCNIYDVNRRYFINPNESSSSGDGIQLDGNYTGFHIHHTIFDRTNGAGNKYSLILNSAPGLSDNATGILEYNTFINSGNVNSAILIERGNGIITRYNTFKGSTQGIRLGGVNTKNNLIHNNLFYNCTNGVGIGYAYPSAGPCTGTKVYNNVFYHVTNYHIWVDRTNVVTRGNIHYRTSDAGVALYNYGGGSWTISNNCYGTAATAGTPGTGTNPQIGNPLFVNPSAYDFHLQSNSPCIDKGINVALPFDIEGNAIFKGSAPDIGAYEYAGSQSNNVAPVISNQTFTVSQGVTNGTLIGTVVASDPNQGQTLAYTITSGNTGGALALNQSSGKLTVAKASALNGNAFNLIVRVTDNGTPALWAQATITVNITAAANQAPVINNQSFSISQNTANSALAGTVVASDPNTGQTLAYTITSGNTNSAFALNQSSGKLTVANASALNGNAFNLIVRVTDNGTPALWAQATITVNITAAANQAPVINNQSFSISQNTANSALAGTVVASDPNTGQTLAYTITSGNTNNAFAINQTNGKITVANTSALNCNAFNLIVRVTDNGTPALWAQATITINIEGSTNQAPVIADQTFTLSQNATNGTYIGTVVASDPNPGQTINFIIISGNPNWAIALGGTQGKLIVSHATSLTGNTINLIVRVTDNGTPALWTEATITINMQRGPNQAPLIANQNFTLSQNAANGTYIGTVVASDPTPGQTLNYTIVSGNPNWAIALGGTQGKLIVSHASALNGNTINLIVRVTNNGTPALSSDANIKISFTKSSLFEEETALPEMEKITEITAFPNPSTNGIFHVKCTEFKNQEGTLTVLSLTGSVIMQDNITGNSETLINLEAMPKGIYILRIVDGENIYTQKLIRQ